VARSALRTGRGWGPGAALLVALAVGIVPAAAASTPRDAGAIAGARTAAPAARRSHRRPVRKQPISPLRCLRSAGFSDARRTGRGTWVGYATTSLFLTVAGPYRSSAAAGRAAKVSGAEQLTKAAGLYIVSAPRRLSPYVTAVARCVSGHAAGYSF
jgi:hypothetical protein